MIYEKKGTEDDIDTDSNSDNDKNKIYRCTICFPTVRGGRAIQVTAGG